MSPSSFRRSALVGLAASLVLVASACGVDLGQDVSAVRAGPGTGTPTSVVLRPESFEGTGGAVFLKEAAEATRAVDSQKVSMTIAMAGVPLLGDVKMSVDGAFDNSTGRGTMSLDMSEFMGGLMGNGDDARIDMILDGNDVYVRSPLFSKLGNSDAEWLKGKASDLESEDSGSTMAPGMGSDPAAYLDFLKATGNGLEEIGREDVRGVSTTHLRTTLDLQKMIDDAPAAEKEKLKKDLEGLGAGNGFDTIPADVWVDDDGYVRRTTLTFDFSTLPAQDGDVSMKDVVMTMTLDIYDIGQPVDVEIPDPADVGVLDPSLLGGN